MKGWGAVNIFNTGWRQEGQPATNKLCTSYPWKESKKPSGGRGFDGITLWALTALPKRLSDRKVVFLALAKHVAGKFEDGCHLEFRLWAIIWALINIFASNLDLVLWWKINSLRRLIGQKSCFQKSKMANGRRLEFRFWAIIWLPINIFTPFPMLLLPHLALSQTPRSAIR